MGSSTGAVTVYSHPALKHDGLLAGRGAVCGVLPPALGALCLCLPPCWLLTLGSSVTGSGSFALGSSCMSLGPPPHLRRGGASPWV